MTEPFYRSQVDDEYKATSAALPDITTSMLAPDTQPCGVPQIDIVKEAVGECAAAVNVAVANVVDQIKECRQACQTSCDSCSSCVQNVLEAAITAAANATGKCQYQVQTYVGRLVGEIVDNAAASGLVLSHGGTDAPPLDDGNTVPSEPPPPPAIIPIGIGLGPPGNDGGPPNPFPAGCIPLPPNGTCPPGYFRSGNTCCPASQCPAGTTYNPVTQRCEANPPPPPPPPGPGCSDTARANISHQLGFTDPLPRCDSISGDVNGQLRECLFTSVPDPTNPNCCEHIIPSTGEGNSNPPTAICDQGGGTGTQTCDSCMGSPHQLSRSSSDSPGFMQYACGIDGVTKSVDAVETPSIGTDAMKLVDFLGFKDDTGSGGIWSFWRGLTDAVNPLKVGGSIVSGFLSAVFGMLDSVLGSLSFTTCGNETSYATLRSWNAIVGIIDRWAGIFPANELQSFKYLINASCPYIIPSVGEADTLWLAKECTDDQWEALVKSNGHCPEWREKLRDLSQTRPSIGDAVTLKLRGLLNDDDYNKLLEKHGVEPTDYGQTYQDLQEYWPGQGELMQWIFSKSTDDQFAARWNLDNGSEVFQDDIVQKYATAAGLKQDQFRFLWRQGQHLPSIAQINELLVRYRPDRRDISDPNPEVEFSEDDADSLLAYHRVPEKMREMIKGLRYTRVSFRHLANAYVYGKYDAADIEDAYKGLGYTDSVSKKLCEALVQANAAKKAVYEGQLPEKTIRQAFDTSAITKEIAVMLIRQLGVPDEIARNRADVWEDERKVKEYQDVFKAIKIRYMRGDFRDDEAHSQLVKAGTDPDRIDPIVGNWRQIREAKSKIPAASMLCSQWKNKLIDVQTYLDRMQNLGWKPQDAAKIVSVCVAEEQQKELKAAIAAADKARRAAIAAEKARLKKLKDDFPCKAPPKPKCPPNIVPPHA